MNFEVKYTIRLYEPSLISELTSQFEKQQTSYKNKNEFFTHIIELGLAANRKEMKSASKKHGEFSMEEDDIYGLLLKVYGYIATQFKNLYIKHTLIEQLLSAVYSIVAALNKGETLAEDKIEDGFYDDIPQRFEKLFEELRKRYGL